MVDPLTAKAHNRVIDLVKTDPSISDHHLVSLLLKEYVNSNKENRENWLLFTQLY